MLEMQLVRRGAGLSTEDWNSLVEKLDKLARSGELVLPGIKVKTVSIHPARGTSAVAKFEHVASGGSPCSDG